MKIDFNDLVELEVKGLRYSQSKDDCSSMILQEKNGDRCMSIVIGAAESRAIDCVLRGIQPPRPLTHDLMCGIMKIFGINLQGVVINMLPEGVYTGAMMFKNQDNPEEGKLIDARSSDAVALALRFRAPIYISGKLLEKISVPSCKAQGVADRVVFDDVADFVATNDEDAADLTGQSLEQLRKRQKQAIEEENYEEAARIKEEIERRFPDTQISEK